MSKKQPEPIEVDIDEQKVADMMGPLPNEIPSASPEEPAAPPPVLPEEKPVTLVGQNDDGVYKIEPSDQTLEEMTKELSQDESAPEAEQPSDPSLDAAVDDITRKDSDKVLEAEDAKLADAFTVEKPSLKAKIKNFLWAWWHNPKAKWGSLIALTLIILATVLYPPARYFTLNTVGVRASASIVVTDQKSQQPLKNIPVTIGAVTAQTGSDGKAVLYGVKLGQQSVIIHKRAFAPIERQVTLGWGTNVLSSVNLVATGERYTFVAVDFLSGKPIPKIEASVGDSTGIANDQGQIELTLAPSEDKTIVVTFNGKDQGYREEKQSISADTKGVTKQAMVISRPNYFISNRSGKYDIYQVDVDGKNEKVVTAGTGKERDDIALITSQDGKNLALVSTRDDQRNKDGYLLSGLFVVDTTSGKLIKVVQSEQIQLIGWLNGRLIYVKIADGTSAASPGRQRLMSYDVSQNESKELASSNYFNDIAVAAGKLYYAPSNAYQDNPTAYLYQVASDGSNKRIIMNKETWNIFRTDYGTFTISTVGQKWYDYAINAGSTAPVALTGPPSQQINRLYIDGPNNNKALWVDNRDGKGVLLSYDTTTKEDKVLATMSGLKYPVYWLNDHMLVFRVKTPTESADYILNLDGGQPHKIQNVSDTTGVDRWYYY